MEINKKKEIDVENTRLYIEKQNVNAHDLNQIDSQRRISHMRQLRCLTSCSPLAAGSHVSDGSRVTLVVTGGLDVAPVVRGLSSELTLGSLDSSLPFNALHVEFRVLERGTGVSLGVVVGGTSGICITSRNVDGWGLEGDIWGVD